MTFCAEYFTTSCSSMLIPNNSFAICDLNPPALRRVQQLTNVLQNVHRGRSKGIFPALAAHGERAYNWKSKEQRNFGPQDFRRENEIKLQVRIATNQSHRKPEGQNLNYQENLIMPGKPIFLTCKTPKANFLGTCSWSALQKPFLQTAPEIRRSFIVLGIDICFDVPRFSSKNEQIEHSGSILQCQRPCSHVPPICPRLLD